MKKRIVITGMGAVTPIGIGVENYWKNVIEGACGIEKMTKVDADTMPVKYAAEVKNFRPRDYLSSRLSTDLDPFMQYAYVSAEEAIRTSGIKTEDAPMRTGIVMGTALHGITLTGDTQKEADEQGDKKIGPRFISKIMGNMAAAQLSINYGIKGPSVTVSTACSSGGDAIGLACMLIQVGAADTMIVMAGEAAECSLAIHSLYKAGALSKSGKSRPFDKNRDGFVIGEGGGAVVLETEEHAVARGANVLAEVLGCGNNSDAFHPVSPDPEGIGAAECMHIALDRAGLSPWDINYVNAHGTATLKGDIAETLALKRVFGAYPVPVSSTKGATGHMMGAGGITETITCVKAIETGILPPTVNYSEPDEECALNIVYRKNYYARIDIAMSNALGFGGQNSSVIVGKYK